MAILFVVTGLGVGVYAFWQATHPPDDQSSANQPTTACVFDIVQNAEVLTDPEAFKPDGDVTKLTFTDLEAGSGPAAKAGDCLNVKYYGTLASSGETFDGNFSTPQALKFQLGAGTVIPGWDEGLQGMKVGGLRRLVIPSELAYQDQASGSIPANSDLVFVVKLLAIQ